MSSWHAAYAAIVITVIGGLIAGSMRFASMEARVQGLESFQSVSASKLDNIAATLARIEGRMEAERELREAERKDDKHR
jgi:hypothetical protein